ncbi:MAG: RNA polymerase factor sigma-54, partial [Hyphomicrobium sp.]
MALSAKLELRQGQQLVMTPQLQQAIRLLQFSNLELAEFVDGELERNPLLEREEPAAKSPEDAPAEERGGSDDGEAPEESWLDLRKPVEDPAGALDTDFDNVFQESPSDTPSVTGGLGALSMSLANTQQRMHNGDEESDIESYLAGEMSLRDHLASQLPLV